MSGFRTDEALRGERIAVHAPPSRVASLALQDPSRRIRNSSLFLFLLTLPLSNPWVRGDGVGYYAYLRSALIDHDLRFENDYLAANQSFVFSMSMRKGIFFLPSTRRPDTWKITFRWALRFYGRL